MTPAVASGKPRGIAALLREGELDALHELQTTQHHLLYAAKDLCSSVG